MVANPPTNIYQRDYWKPDAFFRWWGEKNGTGGYVGLADIIETLQALNPSLHLQNDDEYLRFDQSLAESVVEIVLPAPASDDMMCGISESSKDWLDFDDIAIDGQLGPHHFERTAAGNLLVRPASWHWTCEKSRFGMAFQHGTLGDERAHIPLDQIGRVQSDWGIFRDPGFGELWEVDYAYLPPESTDDSLYGTRTDREWWETTPIGTISYVCKGDLPLETHIDRARAILAAGSQFAIVGDLERLEHRVYRLDGLKIETDKFKLPEMPWFDVPKILPRDDS